MRLLSKGEKTPTRKGGKKQKTEANSLRDWAPMKPGCGCEGRLHAPPLLARLTACQPYACCRAA